MSRRAVAGERLHAVFEANAADLLAYLERRIDPRAEAADVLGDTMVTAWKKAAAMPADPTEARMWLFVVARNTLRNHRRSIGRRRDAVDRLRSMIVDETNGGREADLEQSELRHTVALALATLDPMDAELVRLVNWDGFTIAEIARFESLPQTTVRSRYARALKSLEALLADDEQNHHPEGWSTAPPKRRSREW